jgi:CelD/BcsL family acetyltransferase involved in cellulose biosynthesis
MNHKDRSSKARDGCEEVILGDAQNFVALREEWEDLYRNSSLATPFQSWAWLCSWWEFYGKGYELRLVTIRDNAPRWTKEALSMYRIFRNMVKKYTMASA